MIYGEAKNYDDLIERLEALKQRFREMGTTKKGRLLEGRTYDDMPV